MLPRGGNTGGRPTEPSDGVESGGAALPVPPVPAVGAGIALTVTWLATGLPSEAGFAAVPNETTRSSKAANFDESAFNAANAESTSAVPVSVMASVDSRDLTGSVPGSAKKA